MTRLNFISGLERSQPQLCEKIRRMYQNLDVPLDNIKISWIIAKELENGEIAHTLSKYNQYASRKYQDTYTGTLARDKENFEKLYIFPYGWRRFKDKINKAVEILENTNTKVPQNHSWSGVYYNEIEGL